MVAAAFVLIAVLIFAPRLGQGSAHYQGGNPVGSKTDQFIAWLRAQKGKPYSQTNPQGPGHWDCSGLVQAAYQHIGRGIDRQVTEQAENAPRSIDIKANFKDIASFKAVLRPGDAIGTGWNTSHPHAEYGTRYKHTGIWTGNSIIHASSSSGKVVEVPMSTWWFNEGRKIYAYNQD